MSSLNRNQRSLSRAKAFLKPFLSSKKDRKVITAVYKACSKIYNLELSNSGFSKKFCDLGISQQQLNQIIDDIQFSTGKIYNYKQRDLRENAFDLMVMVML